jgi:hypothetical protein
MPYKRELAQGHIQQKTDASQYPNEAYLMLLRHNVQNDETFNECMEIPKRATEVVANEQKNEPNNPHVAWMYRKMLLVQEA